jgi:hypothetical protein
MGYHQFRDLEEAGRVLTKAGYRMVPAMEAGRVFDVIPDAEEGWPTYGGSDRPVSIGTLYKDGLFCYGNRWSEIVRIFQDGLLKTLSKPVPE